MTFEVSPLHPYSIYISYVLFDKFDEDEIIQYNAVFSNPIDDRKEGLDEATAFTDNNGIECEKSITKCIVIAFKREIGLRVMDIAHECSHSVDTILNHIGGEPGMPSMFTLESELRAYLIGYLADQAFDFLMRNKMELKLPSERVTLPYQNLTTYNINSSVI